MLDYLHIFLYRNEQHLQRIFLQQYHHGDIAWGVPSSLRLEELVSPLGKGL
jgi:hypothetical protein